jgi:hypothetical protein
MWVVSNLVSVYLEMVFVLVQDWCTICAKTYDRLGNHFVRMELLGDATDVEPRFGLFRDGVTAEQDRYTVCVKRTVGS